MNQPMYIGVGANINPEQNIVAALKLLMPQVRVLSVSAFYWSDAVGRDGQPSGRPPFLNGAIAVDTPLDAVELKFDVLRPIEETQGRVRTENSFADRPLDLDILVWGRNVVDTEHLHVPDPNILNWVFVALPLFEVAGDIVLPGVDHHLRQIVEEMDTGLLRRNEQLTKRLAQILAGKD
ncbi:MAG: 2-amino-4-hydroxy-6-hydroxymethyldihydropteridine diphosphokinase [Deltaproteobacteria bacterium]|nr:2-amino-4-hydroxy-6-hydroxymethyldihydropteridine diphosphokinase [Deltaproteobacteria bacterium]